MSPSLKQARLGKLSSAHRAARPKVRDLESLPALLDLTLDHLEANYIPSKHPFAFSR